MVTSCWAISTQTPDWLEPGGRWLRFPKYHPVISPPINQEKILPHAKCYLLKLSPESHGRTQAIWAQATDCLVWHPANIHCTFPLAQPVVSAYWLCYTSGEWIQIQFSNIISCLMSFFFPTRLKLQEGRDGISFHSLPGPGQINSFELWFSHL